MKLRQTTALAALIIGGLSAAAYAQQPPPAGGAPGGPGGGFARVIAPPFLIALVPDMAATLELSTPGGLLGPQGTLRPQYSGIGRTPGGEEATTPPFTWTAGPASTRSYAIILQDFPTDRSMNGPTQWALLNIPAGTTSIPGGIARGASVAQIPGAMQFGAYVAPGPGAIPRTVTPFGGEKELNFYAFEVYALDVVLTIDASASMADLQAAMKGHVVAYGIAPFAVQFGLNPPAFGPGRGAPGGAPPGGAAPPAGAPPAGARPPGN